MNYSHAPASLEEEQKILANIFAKDEPPEFLKMYKIPRIKEDPSFPYGQVFDGINEFKSLVDEPQDPNDSKLSYNLPPRAHWNICSGRPATASTRRPPKDEEENRLDLLEKISTPEGAGAVVDFPLSSPKLEKVRRFKPRYNYKFQSERNGDIPDSDDDDDEPIKSFSDDDSGNGRTPPHLYQAPSPDPSISHRQSHLSDSGASSAENNESDNPCVVPSPEMKLIWRMVIKLEEVKKSRKGKKMFYATVVRNVFDGGRVTSNPVPSPEDDNDEIDEDTETEIDVENLDIDSNDSSEMSVDPPEDILTIMIDEYEMEF